MLIKQVSPIQQTLKLSHTVIQTQLPAFVMGILNITPDSFWEESRRCAKDGDTAESACERAIETALKMAEDGADIIDIGGESSRPGAAYVSADEEMARIIPVIEGIRKHSTCPISVDTRKKTVMHAARRAGADILNDISALEDDDALGAFAAAEKIPVILMHKRGNPDIMQNNTAYTHVIDEVENYLYTRIDYACSCGIAREKIILDPGIGFGKNLAANSALIQHSGKLCGGDFPVLMALSRKTCIGEMTGRAVADRLAGTLAANMFSVLHGAAIVRVHDVAEMVDALKVLKNLS